MTTATDSPTHSPGFSKQITQSLKWITIVGMAVLTITYVVRSMHWQLLHDSPIMHYVVFLMQHGLKPYSHITDINMPGAYLSEWFAMRVFGPSDLAWRIYEFFLLGTLAAAMCIAAGRRNWIAGIYGAGIFLAMHAPEGPIFAGERDEVIAVLILVAYAALFTSVRLQKPSLLLLAGLASGAATSIKPTFLLFSVFLLGMALLKLRRRRVPLLHYALWGTVGVATAGAAALAFVMHYGALRDFWFILHTVIPAYGAKGSARAVIVHVFPRYCAPIVPFVVAASIGNYRQGARWNWEYWALAGGVLFGLFSYAIQGKGFSYHRYEFLVCLFLLFGMEIFRSIHARGNWRWAGLGAILVTVAVTIPWSLWKLRDIPPGSDFTSALENDLQSLGGAQALRDKVICLDMTLGCIDALYHVKIVENGGYTGDMLLFTEDQNAATRYYHNLFLQRAAADPPQVIVISNQDMFKQQGFKRLDNWPSFESYIRDNFTEVIERDFRHEGLSASAPLALQRDASVYRIYISKRSPLLESGRHLASH